MKHHGIQQHLQRNFGLPLVLFHHALVVLRALVIRLINVFYLPVFPDYLFHAVGADDSEVAPAGRPSVTFFFIDFLVVHPALMVGAVVGV